MVGERALFAIAWTADGAKVVEFPLAAARQGNHVIEVDHGWRQLAVAPLAPLRHDGAEVICCVRDRFTVLLRARLLTGERGFASL